MIVHDFHGWRTPFGKRFGTHVADHDVRLTQEQPAHDLRVRPQKVEQLKQHQLRIRVRVDPQFNALESKAQLN